jgi:hypothetical protein
MLFVPHFVGLDAGATRLGCDIDMVGIYQRQKDEALLRILLHGRGRFGNQRRCRATRRARRHRGARRRAFTTCRPVTAAQRRVRAVLAPAPRAGVAHRQVAHLVHPRDAHGPARGLWFDRPPWETTADVEADTRR